MTWDFTGITFLEGTKRRRKGNEETKTGRAKQVGPRGQIPWPRGTTKWSLGHFLAWGFLTRSPPRPKSNSWFPPRGIRSCCSGAPERGKSPSSSSRLLLGVGGGLYIITPIKTSTISIIISVIHSVPLVVWELLYPRYLSCATIYVCDWVLVIICGWSYNFRLCCTTYATEYHHVCTLWVVPICSWGHRMNWQWFIYNMCWYFVKSLSFMWFYDGVVRTSTAQHFTYMGS